MEVILCIETNKAVSNCPGNMQSHASVRMLASLPSALREKVVGRRRVEALSLAEAVNCDCCDVRASASGVLQESWTDC